MVKKKHIRRKKETYKHLRERANYGNGINSINSIYMFKNYKFQLCNYPPSLYQYLIQHF